MGQRVGSQTLGAVKSHISARLKDYAKKELPPQLMTEIINAKTFMLHELFSSKDRAIYKDSVSLTETVNEGCGINLDAGNFYTEATKSLTVGTPDFTGAGITSFTNPSAAQFVGATVILKQAAGGTFMYLRKIASVTSATVVVLDTGIGGNIAGDELYGVIKINSSADVIDISTLGDYQYIDQILAIYDDGVGEEIINAETLPNFLGMVKKQLPYVMKNDIIYVRDGEVLKFAKGASVSAYGERTMHFTRKPYGCVADSDIVDIPNAHLDMLYKLCMLDGLQTLKVAIPSDLKGVENHIGAMRQAKDKEMAELIANKGDN